MAVKEEKQEVMETELNEEEKKAEVTEEEKKAEVTEEEKKAEVNEEEEQFQEEEEDDEWLENMPRDDQRKFAKDLKKIQSAFKLTLKDKDILPSSSSLLPKITGKNLTEVFWFTSGSNVFGKLLIGIDGLVEIEKNQDNFEMFLLTGNHPTSLDSRWKMKNTSGRSLPFIIALIRHD